MLASGFAATMAWAIDPADIVVVSIQGEVQFTVNGSPRSLKPGAVLGVPATVRTLQNASVDLKQGTTTVRVGPDTELNFPAPETRGGPIERVIQPKGNAFYDIGKREGRKFRVETPVLVGVVKGTQFNVAVLDGATTISLFEGRLEVVDAIGGGAVLLNPGEIAARTRDDAGTRVLKMSQPPAGAPPRTSSTSTGSSLPVVREPESRAHALDDVGANLVASDLAQLGTAEPPSAPPPGNDSGAAPVDPVQPDVGIEVSGGATPEPGAGVPPAEEPTSPDVPATPPIDVPGTPPVDVGTDPWVPPDPIDVPDLDDDDGNNGHGNDDDRDDSSNPGRSEGRKR